MLALVTAAQSTHEAIAAIADVIHEQRDTLDALSGNLADTLSTSKSKADALGAMVDETIAKAQAFARDAAPQLVDALLRVRDTANTAADRAREALAVVIPEAAAALEIVLDRRAEARRRRIGRTSGRRTGRSRRGRGRGRSARLGSPDPPAGHDRRHHRGGRSPHRRSPPRTRRAPKRTTIARRSAALIEALNSNAIDLSDALAAETSDSAWAAYLKGDRGVFTRRAVRLLDNGASRDIAELYAADPGFRDQVNRYIHDFEGMLRGVLASREGSPIGVTLLSSDMGKLYVALAQAIERLRA